MPIGDIQYSGKHGPCDLDKLQRHIAWGIEQKCYYIGMGDYIDFASPSNRARLKAAGLYDTAEDVIDEAARQLERDLLKVLLPTKGRWLGILEGHHYFEHLDGTTSDTRIAGVLEAPYLGTCGMVRLVFQYKQRHLAVVIWAHHGAGGGVTLGAPLNKLERVAVGLETL